MTSSVWPVAQTPDTLKQPGWVKLYYCILGLYLSAFEDWNAIPSSYSAFGCMEIRTRSFECDRGVEANTRSEVSSYRKMLIIRRVSFHLYDRGIEANAAPKVVCTQRC
jgi:hypothetical protein